MVDEKFEAMKKITELYDAELVNNSRSMIIDSIGNKRYITVYDVEKILGLEGFRFVG